MFQRIGRSVSHHPLVVVVVWVLLLATASAGALLGVGGGGLFDRMRTSELGVPGSESQEVTTLVGTSRARETTTVVVSGVDMAHGSRAVAALATRLRPLLDVPDAATVVDPFSSGDPTSDASRALLSTAGDGYAVVVTARPGLDDAASASLRASLDRGIAEYSRALRTASPGARVGSVSVDAISTAIIGQVRHDLVVGELVGLPVAAVLMVVVFGGVLAAMMPLLAALSAIGVGMGALWVATFVTDIDSFILNVVSIIGVALSIDYGLLVVSRFREEVAFVVGGREDPRDRPTGGTTGPGASTGGPTTPGRDEGGTLPTTEEVRRAVTRSVATAGRTVTYSAVTIAFALSGLLVMSTHILRTIGLGGVAVTLLALLASVTLVPACITLLGRHMVAPSPVTRIPVVGRVVRAVGDSSSDTGFFSRLAHWVHRRPWWVMGVTAGLLLAMTAPLGSLTLRNNFAEYIPSGTQLRAAYDTVQADYPALAQPSVRVVVDVPPEHSAGVLRRVEGVPGVASVLAGPAGASPRMTMLSVHVDAADQVGPEVVTVMEDLRGLDVGHDMWVGGTAAIQEDFTHSLAQDAPRALGIVVGAVVVLLFLMTGSLLVPLKALVINSLSLLASLGVTTFVFDHGVLGLPRTGGLETFIVACMVAFGFGLAMDYEVFLLSRIKEYWDRGFSNDEAVERGLQRSGRIITSAAAIIIAVFIGFAAGDMIAIKEIGVALAIMVATDATLTRLLLVPATMTLLGRWNWWAPAPLRRLHGRIGLRG